MLTIQDKKFNLANKIGPLTVKNPEFPSNAKVIAASPLIKIPGMQGQRVVLVMFVQPNGTRFVVWDQAFPHFTTDNPDVSDSNFGRGDYFNSPDLFAAAIKRFADRVADFSRNADY